MADIKVITPPNKVSKSNEKEKKIQDKMSEIDEHIAKRFDIKKRLGKGAYGIVWKAVEKKTKQVVAIKKIFDAFRNQTDAQRTFREIIFLLSFKNHPNIIKLHSIHRAANNKDIYLGFEYMHTDLHNVIKSGNILKDIHKRYIMYQMLKATKYIHSGNVIHRDQKPSNVLIDNACRVKIADFGLARSISSFSGGGGEGGADPCLTDYVATRWYRPPEILIASKNYTKGIDMWSLGCILGEMMIGKPLFPGSSTVNQVERIMGCIPPPTEEDIVAVCTGYGSSLIRQSVTRRKSLRELLLGCPEDAIELTGDLLVFNPAKRPTAEQALQYTYVSKFHEIKNEPVLAGDIIPPLCDNHQLSVDEYRNRLYGLIKRRAMRNAEKTKECTTTMSETKLQGPYPPIKPVRPRNLPIQSRTQNPDKSKTSLSGILNQYAHKSHSDSKIVQASAEALAKTYKPTSSEHKLSDKLMAHGSSLERKYKTLGKERNPLRRNLSNEEHTYDRRNSQFNGCIPPDVVKTKCRGDFVRSMSDETEPRAAKKPVVKRHSSFSCVSTADQFERSTFSKFSQKHGIITASALMELRSSIR